MSDTHRLAEAAVAYGAAVADLRLPLILEQEGRPVAVILPFDEYERLRQSALANVAGDNRDADRMAFLATFGSWKDDRSDEEIIADIYAARTTSAEERSW